MARSDRPPVPDERLEATRSALSALASLDAETLDGTRHALDDDVEWCERELEEARARLDLAQADVEEASRLLDNVRRQRALLEHLAEGGASEGTQDAEVALAGLARRASQARPRKGPPGMRDLVLRCMRRRPEETWTPQLLHKVLREEIPEVKVENVRMTLVRMFKAGELVRVGRGAYRLP